MVIAKIITEDTDWEPDYNIRPEVIEGDNPLEFIPRYIATEEAETSSKSLKSKFADLPSAGIWADRTESDDELLEQLGSGWRGFTTK